MNSKEIKKKIDYLIQAEDQDLVNWDENGNIVNIQYLKDIKSYIEKLEKDAEVLEMLRPHLINAGIGMFDNVGDNEIFHLKLNLSGKEYKMIEEWIKNGIK